MTRYKNNSTHRKESKLRPSAKESSNDIQIAQSSVNMQQRDALQKFKKEFAARKRKRDMQELKEIDLL